MYLANMYVGAFEIHVEHASTIVIYIQEVALSPGCSTQSAGPDQLMRSLLDGGLGFFKREEDRQTQEKEKQT